MKEIGRTYKLLMVFLLLWVVLPFELDAQENNSKSQVQHYEEQLLMILGENLSFQLNGEGRNSLNLPDHVKSRAMSPNSESQQWAGGENQNEIYLFMAGSENEATATQQNGTGNLMNLGITGSQNVAEYQQQGSNNYLFDRVSGNGIHREISQFGNELGIYNQGMQSVPMIINQRGRGMNITITGPPFIY